MNINPFKELQKLFKRSSLKDSTFDKEKNSITIKDIHNSSIEINLWDEDDLKELRDLLEKSLLKRFDQIIAALKRSKIKHFFSIDELKTSTPNHRFLFKNNLFFFTEEEIESHYQIIQHIQEDRVALLLGFPATGKSIAVIDIAAKLALEGYNTYYFSFKKIKHWPEIWTELKTHANEKTVFVLDDVHLDPETAGTTLNRLSKDPALNILFISREIYKNRNFTDTLNIYKELDTKTVRTAQPNINKKVEGIVKLYQAYYQKETQGAYPIGDFDKINTYVHRNLIVLNAYLKHWKNHPRLELSALEESKLYQGIFEEYFQNLEIKTRIVLLQYLCLYYFEVEFYANPKEDKATKQLLDKAIITKDKGDLYSIYHGEYAFLLLKAFQFIDTERFYEFGNDWTIFFASRIREYLQGFIESSGYSYPYNLLEILTAIPRFTKEVHGGIKDTNSIFKLLVEVPSVKKLILKSCKKEQEEKTIAFFLYSILYNCPNQFESFFRAFSTKVFENKYALLIYSKAYKVLSRENQLDWFEAYSDVYLPLIIKNTALHRLGYALSSLYQFYDKKAKFVYSKVSILNLLSKTKNATLKEISQALNQLVIIAPSKTKKIYIEIINTDEERLKKMIFNANFQELGNVLSQLYQVSDKRTIAIYKSVDINSDRFKKMVFNANLQELSQALSQLNKVDKTKKIYTGISIHSNHFKEIVLNANLQELGLALNQLNNIDPAKTEKIYGNIDIKEKRFKNIVYNTNLNKLSRALNELKNIDPAKTKEIYDNIDIDEKRFKNIVYNTNLNKLGLALNELKNIDSAKTKEVYDNIDINEKAFKAIVRNTNLNKLGRALNELKNIDLAKTKEIYANIDIKDAHFKELVLNTNLKKLGDTLNQLKNIDLERTQEICTCYEIVILNKVKRSNLKYKDFIQQINSLSRVSPNLGLSIYKLITKNKIYQLDKLDNIYTFNLLAQYLLNINLSFQDENFIKVIRSGVKNVSFFLKSPIHPVSTYIGIMAKLNQNISKQIEKNISRYTKAILKKDNANRVPRLIANIFMHSQSLAIDLLLDKYQSTYPNNKIMLINVYIEIARNNAQKEDKQTATRFLQKALNITQTLDNQDLENRITYTINKYELNL